MLFTLPQETLNHIIAHLRGEDHALRSLSLVDRRLTEECHTHLFSSVRIDSATQLRRWCDAIPPGKDGLSRYVRSLKWRAFQCTPISIQDHMDHFRSFSRLEYLHIRPLDLTKFPSQELTHWFGHFSTVRSLCIQITGSPRTIVNFLALFPLLETTVITAPNIWRERPEYVGGDEADLDFPNLVCRGDLVFKVYRVCDKDDVLSALARLTTCYRRLGMGVVMMDSFAPLELFLKACGRSLESIQLINFLIREVQVSSSTVPY